MLIDKTYQKTLHNPTVYLGEGLEYGSWTANIREGKETTIIKQHESQQGVPPRN